MVSRDSLYTSLGILLFLLQQSNYQNNASDKLLSDIHSNYFHDFFLAFMTLDNTSNTQKKRKITKEICKHHNFLTLPDITNETWCPEHEGYEMFDK